LFLLVCGTETVIDILGLVYHSFIWLCLPPLTAYRNFVVGSSGRY